MAALYMLMSSGGCACGAGVWEAEPGAGRSGCHGVEPWLTVAEEAKRIQAMTISFGVPHLAGIEQNWRWVRELCLVLAL